MNRRLTHWLMTSISLALPACQQRMADQPAPRPDDTSAFFADGRADRPLVPGTVARGHLRTDLALFTGKRTRGPGREAEAAILAGAATNPLSALLFAAIDRYRYLEEADYVDTFPFPITRDVLEQGRNRYMIFCVVCHDALGTGHGKIVERGYTQPPSFHIERLRQVAVGHFFDVITNGYGSMPEYKQQVPPRDRWAIAAYIRALQLSQHFPVKDLPADLREEWQKTATRETNGRGPQ